MHDVSFEQAMERIRARDPRYTQDVYLFVRQALDHTQKRVSRQNRGRERHVTGQELLAGIREFALAEFGPMAMTVFGEWGVKSCRDFGEIVFNMIEVGWLKKTDTDSREDFDGGYDFYEAFQVPFLPSCKRAVRGPNPKHARA
jgi:uncharacterized repeat protein (TIGR04138 family)